MSLSNSQLAEPVKELDLYEKDHSILGESTQRSAASNHLGQVVVVLPAYNEEQGLPSLLAKIERTCRSLPREYRVILVDDASQDGTSLVGKEAALQMPVEVIRHEQNQGLAGAIRTGLSAAVKVSRPGDVIITMDADDTHEPGSIHRLLQLIEDGYDVVIASRYQPGSRVMGVPANRLLMTWGARWLFKALMPIEGVRDYTCGYRAYRFEALNKTMEYYGVDFVSEQGFSCMVDVLLKMRRFGFAIGEAPMLLRYDQKQGPSKMRVARTMWQTITLLIKRRFGGY